MRILNALVQFVVFSLVAAAGIAVGWFLFLEYPTSATELVGIVLLLMFAPLAVRVAGTVASSIMPSYNVAEVSVTGPITRGDSSGVLSRGPMDASADTIVDQIEQADADRNATALLVHLNTPGGEIVPSEDIKHAAEQFDGPTVAYTTDTCASGGYEIASGCDEIWARKGSIVGSIGVIGSRVTAADLADRLGLQYEQLTAGEYKDAGAPLKELEPHEREYLQGIVDEYYDYFVENVSERRELDAEAVRDTEARVFLGEQAKERDLVDELGTRDDVVDRLEEQLGTEIQIKKLEPRHGLTERVRIGTQQLAYAFGAGITSTFTDDESQFKLR